MSIPNIEKLPSPEITYRPGGNPAAYKLAREVFFISVGSSAIPVLAAAIIMFQGGHGLPPKIASAPSAQKATARSVAPLSKTEVPASRDRFTDTTSTPHPALISSSASPVKEDSAVMALPGSKPVAELSPLRFQPLADPADVVGRIQTLKSGNDFLQRNPPLSLALVSIPTTSSIHDANAVAVEEPNPESRTTGVTASPAKKIRAEVHPHAIAHHRHRPQKHLPPSLLAKIGQSVKKGLMNIAKFPRQAMERRSWD